MISALEIGVAKADGPMQREQALLAHLRTLFSAFESSLPSPTDDELVDRLMDGELDPVTVCQIAGWSESQLADECSRRGYDYPL